MAATPLWQVSPGAIDWTVVASLYGKTFDEVKVKTQASPREGAQFFGTRSTNEQTYKEGEAHQTITTPPKNEDSDRIPLITPTDGYNQTWTNYIRRLGFIVTQSAVTRQRVRAIAQLINGLPECAKVVEELAYADMFNNGFATNTGGDGSYVFATDHYYEDPQYGQWANKTSVSAAFATDSFVLAWLNLMQRKTASYFPMPMKPAAVYYPVAIQEAVSKVHNSSQYPQNALNAKMDPLFSAWEMVPGVWLSSQTAWFVHAQVDEMNKGLVIVWEQKPQYSPILDGMNPDIVLGRRLRMSFSTGCLIARDWCSNVGA